MKLRICIVTSSFPRHPTDASGIFVYNLAKWLAKKGLALNVIAPHDNGSRFKETLDGITIHRFPYFFPFQLQKLSYRSGIMKNIRQQPATASLIPVFLLSETLCTLFIAKRIRPDILHAHWTIPQGISGVICKKLLKIPLVTTVHGSDIFSFSRSKLNSLNTWILKHSTACTVNSSATAAAVHKMAGIDPTIIPMGVDTDFFRPKKKKKTEKELNGRWERTILFVGRLIDWKGVDNLVRAMPLVLAKFPASRLIVVGEGLERQRLENLSRELGVAGSIDFTGGLSQNEIVDYYRMADVFVLPSIINEKGETEGLGVVLLEALACGVPVVGTKVGGIVDIIAHEKTGLLVPQKSPEKLAGSIVRLFEEDALRQATAKNGREFIEARFSWNVISDAFIKTYNSIS
ncbi:MAG: glycosyltransferase [Desulfobacterales bacterium]